MEQGPRQRRPGDIILDHYMPNATDAEREAARENLRSYAAVILRIFTRMAEEEIAREIRANRDCAVDSEGDLTSPT
jgi:hypothetical protein